MIIRICLDYWKHEEELIAYLLVDNIMYLGYKKNKVIHEAFDTCDTFHYPVDYFQNQLNDVYDEKMENRLACGDDFFKLTYKKNLLMENNGKPTLWNVLRRRVLNV